jgi:hypothetical protein
VASPISKSFRAPHPPCIGAREPTHCMDLGSPLSPLPSPISPPLSSLPFPLPPVSPPSPGGQEEGLDARPSSLLPSVSLEFWSLVSPSSVNFGLSVGPSLLDFLLGRAVLFIFFSPPFVSVLPSLPFLYTHSVLGAGSRTEADGKGKVTEPSYCSQGLLSNSVAVHFVVTLSQNQTLQTLRTFRRSVPFSNEHN